MSGAVEIATPPALRTGLARWRPLLSRGPVWLISGSALSGASAYGYQILAARALGPARYASLSALWTLAFLIGPGVFGPHEQEVSRLTSARLAKGVGARPVLFRLAVVGSAYGLIVLGGLGIAWSFLLQRAFDGQELLVASLALSLVGYYCMHLTWGVLAGTSHFRGYASVTAGEGLMRLLIGVAVLAFGFRTGGPLGLAIGLAPFAAAAIGWWVGRPSLNPGPPEPWPPVARAVGVLVVGNLVAQVLISIAPFAVKILAGPHDQVTAGNFQAGATLTRVPLFLFNAVLVALLPRFSSMVAKAQHAELARLVRKLTLAVAGIMVLVVVGIAALGPTVVSMIFGPGFHLGASTQVLLASAAGLYMVSGVYAIGLIALGGHLFQTIACTLACAVFILLMALGGGLGLLNRVAWGFVAGTATLLLTSHLSFQLAKDGKGLGLLRVPFAPDAEPLHASPDVAFEGLPVDQGPPA